jgi:hypothetical protein
MSAAGTVRAYVGLSESCTATLETRLKYSSVVCGGSLVATRRPCAIRATESGGVPSVGGAFVIVSVSEIFAAASGAGKDAVPPKPFELGSVIVAAPPPGLSTNVCVVDALNGELAGGANGATDVVAPHPASSAAQTTNAGTTTRPFTKTPSERLERQSSHRDAPRSR